jgi:hypothetical protein
MLAVSLGASVLLVGTSSAWAAPLFTRTGGNQEIPGPGDPNGFGAGLIQVRPDAEQVCLGIRFRGIGTPTAMHIHAGGSQVSGGIVVNLTPALSGTRCITGLDSELLTDIETNPSQYYLNIHTAAFPAGATRGQLERSQVPSTFGTVRGPLYKFARMSGGQEIPGPGDQDGRGAPFIDLNPALGRVCIDVRFRNIETPTLMHIHEGAAGVAGPVRVNLTGTLNGGPRCVTGVDSALVSDIRQNPSDYYCNIHNGPFPAGAIRGQLETSQN